MVSSNPHQITHSEQSWNDHNVGRTLPATRALYRKLAVIVQGKLFLFQNDSVLLFMTNFLSFILKIKCTALFVHCYFIQVLLSEFPL